MNNEDTGSLKERPVELLLRWSSEERQTFPGCGAAARFWGDWLKHQTPTDAQLYRKLLLDLFIDYMRANHFGAEFDTADMKYEEFNRCTGRPITSTEDYVDRIRPLLDFMVDHQEATVRDRGAAILSFIVAGDPTRGSRETEPSSD